MRSLINDRGQLKAALERDRLYATAGRSTFISYDLKTLFTRMSNDEPLIPAIDFQSLAVSWRGWGSGTCLGGVGTQRDNKDPVTRGQISFNSELILPWDSWFDVDTSEAGWQMTVADFDSILTKFDTDDRGYVYLGTDNYGEWGIFLDRGQTGGAHLENVLAGRTSLGRAVQIATVRDSHGSRFVLVSQIEGNPLKVFNVDDPANPVARPDLGNSMKDYAKAWGNKRFAIVDQEGVKIYNVDDLLSNGAPLFRLLPSSERGRFLGLATDGKNFFAFESIPDPIGTSEIFTGRSIIHVLKASSDSLTYSLTSHTVPFFSDEGGAGFSYGAGYLVVTGLASSVNARSVALFSLNGLVPREVPINDYFARNYFRTDSPNGFLGNYFVYKNAIPLRYGDKTYLVMVSENFGDIYELSPSSSN